MDFQEKIDLEKLPQHVAIIMDGNGRWARMRGKHRVFGHEQGVVAVRETVTAAAELGIKHLTLYAFSTENWNRPIQEVESLMELLVQTINIETKTLMDNNIRLLTIGDTQRLSKRCSDELQEAIKKTAANTRTNVVLALSYSSRWEITQAMKKIATKIQNEQLSPEEINEELISAHLATVGMPDPELLIRTSGEYRISNFLLWQSAYTEMYFTPTLWPDFRKNDFYQAIVEYQQRERRFGRLNEQLNKCKK